jgi:hypothetical protein
MTRAERPLPASSAEPARRDAFDGAVRGACAIPVHEALMLSTTCHCGAVTIRIPRPPETLTNCDCSICRRYGTLWAYYPSDEVSVQAAPGATQAYAWGRRHLRFVRCGTCGCISHWEAVVGQPGQRMGVNARNFEPEQLGAVRIRRLDGVKEEYLDD